MKQGYEDAFMDLQSDYISLCLEYAEGQAEEVFAYLYRTETMRMFNAFFRSGGKILAASQMPTTCNDEEFMQVGRDDISRLEEICHEYEAAPPNEIRMHYDVKTGRYDADVSYEDYSIKDKVTPMQVFMKWLKEEKQKCTSSHV